MPDAQGRFKGISVPVLPWLVDKVERALDPCSDCCPCCHPCCEECPDWTEEDGRDDCS